MTSSSVFEDSNGRDIPSVIYITHGEMEHMDAISNEDYIDPVSVLDGFPVQCSTEPFLLYYNSSGIKEGTTDKLVLSIYELCQIDIDNLKKQT